MNKMKKCIALFLAVLMIPWAALAQTAETAEIPQVSGHTVEAKTFPYLRSFDDEEEPVQSTMTLYFIDGGDIPYVALSEYMPFFAALMKDFDEWEDTAFEVRRAEGVSDINDFFFSLVSNDAAMSEYMASFQEMMRRYAGNAAVSEAALAAEAGAVDTYFVTRPDNGTNMVFLPFADQILFDSYNLFTAKPGVTSLVAALDLPEPEEVNFLDEFNDLMAQAEEIEARGEEVPSDFFEDFYTRTDPAYGRHFFVNAGRSFNRHGSGTYLDLGAYGIHLYSIGGECYVPFQTMNDLFMNQNYLQYIWNGQTVIGAAYGGALLEKAKEAGPQEMSREFAVFNYNELLFLLDTFYGLKPEHNIVSFRDMIAHNPQLTDAFMTYRSADFDSAVMLLTGLYLDDLHSGYNAASWRSPAVDEFQEFINYFQAMGYSNSKYFSDGFRYSGAREEAYPEECPGYEEVGDTAFITFDGFSCSAIPEDYSEYYDLGIPASLEDCGDDTIRLLQYANAQIKRENSPIKNVVIDLSNNGGGSVAAAVAVMCWYLDECSFALRDTMTGALSIMNYDCDLNLNEQADYDDGDTLANQDYHLYCLISPLSFSCGNLVPAFFRDSHAVTLIGQRSGGGSCVVLPCTSASGTQFQISGTKQIALVRNGSFYNVDEGIEPDIVLTKPASFYDRPGLVELIHSTR